MRATLSLRGLYLADPDLFSLMRLPGSISAQWTDYDTGEVVKKTYDLNKSDIVHAILDEAAELEVLYPNAATLKQMIGNWSALHLPLWTRMWEDLCTHYFFQYNKDGIIDVTYGYNDRKDVDSFGTGADAFKSTTTVTRGITVTTTGSRWGFNGDDAVPVSEAVEKPNDGTDTESVAQSGTRSHAMTGEETERRHEYGNIGVTMSSQILRDELEVRQAYELPDIIKNQFIERFCLLIY